MPTRRRRRRAWRLALALLLLLPALLVARPPGPVAAGGCVVTTTTDTGAGARRAALGNTNGFSACTAITVQAGVTGTIPLASDLPPVNTTVSVTGPDPTAASLTVNRGSTACPSLP